MSSVYFVPGIATSRALPHRNHPNKSDVGINIPILQIKKLRQRDITFLLKMTVPRVWSGF